MHFCYLKIVLYNVHVLFMDTLPSSESIGINMKINKISQTNNNDSVKSEKI